MNCDVCTQTMGVLRRLDDSRGVGTWYVCPWCQAEALVLWGKPTKFFPYRPVDERWAAATAEKTGADVEHAAHGEESTLCGLTGGLTIYRHHWRPGPGACVACVDVAQAADARWPLNKRS